MAPITRIWSLPAEPPRHQHTQPRRHTRTLPPDRQPACRRPLTPSSRLRISTITSTRPPSVAPHRARRSQRRETMWAKLRRLTRLVILSSAPTYGCRRPKGRHLRLAVSNTCPPKTKIILVCTVIGRRCERTVHISPGAALRSSAAWRARPGHNALGVDPQ